MSSIPSNKEHILQKIDSAAYDGNWDEVRLLSKGLIYEGSSCGVEKAIAYAQQGFALMYPMMQDIAQQSQKKAEALLMAKKAMSCDAQCMDAVLLRSLISFIDICRPSSYNGQNIADFAFLDSAMLAIISIAPPMLRTVNQKQNAAGLQLHLDHELIKNIFLDLLKIQSSSKWKEPAFSYRNRHRFRLNLMFHLLYLLCAVYVAPTQVCLDKCLEIDEIVSLNPWIFAPLENEVSLLSLQNCFSSRCPSIFERAVLMKYKDIPKSMFDLHFRLSLCEMLSLSRGIEFHFEWVRNSSRIYLPALNQQLFKASAPESIGSKDRIHLNGSNGRNLIQIFCDFLNFETLLKFAFLGMDRSQQAIIDGLERNESDSANIASSQKLAVDASSISAIRASKLFPSKSPRIKALVNPLISSLSMAGKFDQVVGVLRNLTSQDMENVQVWYKLSLSLMCNKEYDEAHLAIRNCLFVVPENFSALLIACKLCLNHLSKSAIAFQYAESAMNLIDTETDEKQRCGLKCICDVMLGVVCSRLAIEATSFSRKKHFQEKSLSYLEKACEHDADNPNTLFHLACVLADTRDVNRAIYFVKKAISLDSSNPRYWQLLALLSSSSKASQKAELACIAGIQECGDDPILLYTRASVISVRMLDFATESKRMLSFAKLLSSLYQNIIEKLFPFQKQQAVEFRTLRLLHFFKSSDDLIEEGIGPWLGQENNSSLFFVNFDLTQIL